MDNQLQKDLYKRIQKLDYKIQYNIVVKSIIQFLGTPLLMILLGVLFSYIHRYLSIYSSWGEGEDVWFLMLSTILVILVAPFFTIYLVRSADLVGRWIEKGIHKMYDSIKDIGQGTYSIDEILDKNNLILLFVKKLSSLNNRSFLFNKGAQDMIQELSEDIPKVMLDIVYHLKSQLIEHISQQQQILESAKTEVEKNLTGTPELLAVSEAQQVRLDRQIEQFEELQRVLVKV